MTIIYAACVAGAIGLIIALPRRGARLALLGGVIAAGALGAAFLAITPAAAESAGESAPDLFFYLLSFIAAAGGLRMITHPRPVYAALYFILVVLASAGLLLLLAAEFMAFALVIVYAGAILITYLFVIMLAQETPDERDWTALMDYDANAREPVAAVLAGFLLLAVLLGVGYRGMTPTEAPWNGERRAVSVSPDEQLAMMPRKVERALREGKLIPRDAVVREVHADRRQAEVALAGGERQLVDFPDDLRPANVESIGLSLFNDFPVSLELAGVILFMAMLGAVVLARKPSVVGWSTDEEGENRRTIV